MGNPEVTPAAGLDRAVFFHLEGRRNTGYTGPLKTICRKFTQDHLSSPCL